MVYNLGLYFGIEGKSCWDTIDKMKRLQIINETGHENLQYAVSFANLLRLKSYFQNNAQTGKMSIFPKHSNSNPNVSELFEEDLDEHGELFNYFYRAIPLYNKLKEFCSKNFENLEERAFFQNESFFESGPITKGLIYYRLQQPKNALRLLAAAVTLSNDENKMIILHFMGDIYLEIGQYEKFFEVFNPLGDHREFISFTKKQKTRIFKKIESQHELKENYDKAFECLVKIEEIEENSANSKFNLDELLYTLQLISDVHQLTGDSESAQKYLSKRLYFQNKHKKDSSEVAKENEKNPTL
jgi:tetratricopeptide (TPR) repeat protein